MDNNYPFNDNRDFLDGISFKGKFAEKSYVMDLNKEISEGSFNRSQRPEFEQAHKNKR